MWNRKPVRWNIFARELEDVLASHGLRLTQLDDRLPIHREKIRRLVKSLQTPKNFPVLNPNEIDLIADTIGLNALEVLRLRAAILTTAIEAMLMDRIPPYEALQVAEQVLPMIFDAMKRGALSAVRGQNLYESIGVVMEEPDIDIVLEGPLELIDHATMALHLCRNVDAHNERARFARQALKDFEEAIVELAKADQTIQATNTWQVWQQDAQKGILTARDYLSELEE